MKDIRKRTKLSGNSELLPFTTQQKDLDAEMNYHSWKAGATTKNGECRRASKIQISVPFGKPKYNLWPRDENDQLIGD